MSRKTSTCASTGYFARLFAKKNLKIPVTYYNCGIAITKRQQRQNFISLFNVFALTRLQKQITDSPTFPVVPDFSLITLQFPNFSGFSRRVVTLK